MMKKLFAAIVVLIICTNSYCQTNYYVATTGNDANTAVQAQNPATPWKTIRKASATVVGNSIINVGAGTFNEPLQLIFAPLVSITGVDSIQTKVVLTFYDSSTHNGCIKFESTSLTPVNGNQFIRNLWLDGSSQTAYSCLLVKARNNVSASGLKITNFRAFGAHFNGSIVTLGTVPPFFSSGSSIINGTITNCGDRHKVGGSGLLIAAQDGFLVDNMQFDNRYRPAGQNGNCLTMVSGNNKAVHIYNSRFFKPLDEGPTTPNFCIESWRELGGYEVYRCTFNGGGDQIDAGTEGSVKGIYGYNWWVHENTFQMAQQLPTTPLAQYSIGFQFEDDCNGGIIENNHFKNLGIGVMISSTHAADVTQNHRINNNLFENMGYLDKSYGGWGAIYIFITAAGGQARDLNIYNNTMIENNTGKSGIFLGTSPSTNNGTIRNITFTNNIVTGCTGYGYIAFGGNNPVGIDSVFAKNNASWNNAFTNNAFYVSPKTAAQVTHFVTTENGVVSPPLKQDPLFVSTTDFHLASGSPCISSGLSPPNTYRGAFSAGTIVPTITWANPAAITYPTPLSSTQLNATSGGVPGTFAYNPASGTVLTPGTYTLTVVFTPTDLVTYSVVSKQATLVVNKGTATLAYSNLTQTYTGSPLQPTVTTTPAGLTVVNTIFDGLGTIPTNVGTYAVVSGLTNPNYQATSISGTFNITKATATINVSNLNQTYDGTPKPITASTSPVGLSGLTILYNGSATVPTNAGSYAVNVTLSNPNYQATPVNTTLVIAKATPTVSWSNPAAITYPTALSGTQLNATASIAGTLTYTPASGAVLNAGSQTLSVNFVPTDAANYNSVNNTTVTIIVNKGTATISLSNLAQVYDGAGKSATATTNPVGLLTVSITYNGSATLPINAGSYAVIASLSNPNYTATNATGNLVISKATAILLLTNTSYTYDATPKSVTVTTAPSGLTVVSVTYDGSPTAPTNAGSYAVEATLTNTNYQGSVSGTLAIAKATPVISWSTPAAITYGTALSGTQLTATSGGVAGTFTYTPPAGTILNAGSNILIVDFTPTDASNYNSVNGTTVTIVVNKATATINLSNLNQDFDGNPKPVTVTTTPLGLGVISVTYNGSGTPPSAIGSYTVNATLTNSNYTATPATGTLVISPVSANINITDLNQTYTGSPLPVTVTTSPPALAHTDTYNGSGTVPTNAGTYIVIATLNSPNVGADTATYVIAKANPVITWSNPGAITYGTALNGTQLNASASVAGVLTYTPVSGTVLNAGTQILSVGFVPTDAANYNSIPVTTVTLVVNKAVATLSTSNTTQVFDGSPKPVTVTSSPVGLTTVVTTYNGSTTPPTAVGTYQVISNLVGNSNYTAVADTVTLTITATAAGISISNLLQVYTGSPLPVTVSTNPTGLTYTVTYNASATVPTNAGSYTVIATLTGGTYTGADTQTLVIVKATPVIIWNNPANITFGTALSSTQLNATTSVAGSFAYVPTTGTVLNVGTQSLTTTFTPTDAANYNSAIKIVSITVTGGTATLTLSNLSQTYNGTPRSVIVTTNPVGLSGVIVLYNGSSSPPTNAGSYTINVTLVNANYIAAPVSGTLVIAKATPILSWAAPAQIVYPTPLSVLQLNATANIAGTFTYNPTFGAILNPGTSALTATFHPTDAVNYNTATISVPLSVAGNALLNFTIIHNTGQVYLNFPFP